MHLSSWTSPRRDDKEHVQCFRLDVPLDNSLVITSLFASVYESRSQEIETELELIFLSLCERPGLQGGLVGSP